MNHPNTRLNTERDRLRQALQRLQDGRPERSNGNLTITTLAIEAAIPRHRIYSHHPDLVDQLHTHARGGPTPHHVTALQQQLTDAHDRIKQLETANAELQTQTQTLAAIIAENAHEAAADNVVGLDRFRHRRTAQ